MVGRRVDLEKCGIPRPHRDSIPDCPALSKSLYRLSYPDPLFKMMMMIVIIITPYSRVLLEELKGTQLIQKFPAFYRI